MKRLVLAGGGHAHVEVLRAFRALPLDESEVVLVSPDARTPYSGMLPGMVAGHYREDECHIDLAPLTAFRGCRFLRTRLTDVVPEERRVTLETGMALEYDWLSLDIGATPTADRVPGAAAHAIGVKPVEAFLQSWTQLLERAAAGALARIAVVGGGAAGVEMLLAMQHRLRYDRGCDDVDFHLVTDAAEVLPSHGRRVRRVFARVLGERRVNVHISSAVERVEHGRLYAAGGLALDADAIVWATGAGAPKLVQRAGLAVDQAGFALVGGTLQSVSHPEVFAVGDVATMRDAPRPKSGVFAVRQGPPLADNLRAVLEGKPLERYVPQRRALALITTGDRCAVASRGPWTASGQWVWQWKDWTDRRFMRRYAFPA